MWEIQLLGVLLWGDPIVGHASVWEIQFWACFCVKNSKCDKFICASRGMAGALGCSVLVIKVMKEASMHQAGTALHLHCGVPPVASFSAAVPCCSCGVQHSACSCASSTTSHLAVLVQEGDSFVCSFHDGLDGVYFCLKVGIAALSSAIPHTRCSTFCHIYRVGPKLPDCSPNPCLRCKQQIGAKYKGSAYLGPALQKNTDC